MEFKEDYLRRAPLFSLLEERLLARLAHYSEMKTFPAGHVIVRQGAEESWELGLYIIARGRVRIVRVDADGEERELAQLGPGECFGEMSIIDGEPRSASALTMEPTECLFLGAIDFREALAREPKIAINLLRVLSRRLRQADQALLD